MLNFKVIFELYYLRNMCASLLLLGLYQYQQTRFQTVGKNKVHTFV